MKRNRKQYTPEFKWEAAALVEKQGHGAFVGQGHQAPEQEEIAQIKRAQIKIEIPPQKKRRRTSPAKCDEVRLYSG